MAQQKLEGVDPLYAPVARAGPTINALLTARAFTLMAGWVAVIACAVTGVLLMRSPGQVRADGFTRGPAEFSMNAEAFGLFLTGFGAAVGAMVLAAILRGVAAMLLALTAPRAE